MSARRKASLDVRWHNDVWCVIEDGGTLFFTFRDGGIRHTLRMNAKEFRNMCMVARLVVSSHRRGLDAIMEAFKEPQP